MKSSGHSGGIYRPLSDEQIQTIHEAALMLLEKTGMTYETGLDETLDLLASKGADVDRAGARVRFPRDLITEQAAKAPERVVLYSRDGENDLDLTEHRVHAGTGGAAIKVLDPGAETVRPSRLDDIYQLGRLVDGLKHIHFYLRPCIPTDIPEDRYDENIFFACLKATGKHIMGGVNNEEGLRKILDLGSIAAGDGGAFREKPFISIITSFAISPLKLCTQSTKIMQECNRNGIPVALSSAPMAGSTSPMTMAGTLAQLHAEELAGIAICQLTRPGAPLLYGGIPSMANMSSMGYMGGAVEFGMMNAAIHQLSHHIRVPNYNSGGLTESKLPDAQAAWEKGLTVLLAVMGGSNYIHHAAGMLESMLTVSYEQFVMDDEIVGMCCKVLEGIDTDPEHLALEVIDAVGPGGNYMTAAHTMTHMRREFFTGNSVTDRKNRERWESEGSRDARLNAGRVVEKILSKPAVSYLSEDAERAIKDKYEILLQR